jgi:hypothetical protein
MNGQGGYYNTGNGGDAYGGDATNNLFQLSPNDLAALSADLNSYQTNAQRQFLPPPNRTNTGASSSYQQYRGAYNQPGYYQSTVRGSSLYAHPRLLLWSGCLPAGRLLSFSNPTQG